MSSNQGVLFLRNENEEFKWFEHGDKDGQGTFMFPDGRKYVVEWKG